MSGFAALLTFAQAMAQRPFADRHQRAIERHAIVGDAQQFAIAVAPGNAQVRVIVELTGDTLRGEIVRKQESAALQIADLPEALADARELLQTAVAEVKRLESRVSRLSRRLFRTVKPGVGIVFGQSEVLPNL